MTVLDEQDPARIPGRMKEVKERALDGLGVLSFETAPAGWLTQAGEIRRAEWRRYYLASRCGGCDGSGRVPGKTDRGRICPKCRSAGTARRTLPSVTTLLDDICGAGGLPSWAEARGIEGAIIAVRRGLIDPSAPDAHLRAIEIVREHQLGADRARLDSATRGIDVHKCLEHYMLTGSPPSPALFPPEYRGYLQALSRWLLKADPEPEAVEQLVCHPEDGYAGRLDLRARIGGALATVDAKTQERAAIYVKAHAQVNLYERGAVRCGDEPADRLLIVVFAANGEFREMPADHAEAFTDAALAWIREGRPVNQMCEAHNRAEREARKAVAA